MLLYFLVFVLLCFVLQLRVEQSALAGGDKPIGGSGTVQSAGRRRQQRLFSERVVAADAPLDMGDCFHSSLRAGGSRIDARRYCDQRVTFEWGAAA